jgi:hypothetical protein
MGRKVKSGPADPAPEPKRSGTRADPAIVQSGDLQGLNDDPEADSESVRELLEEGQAFEASVVNAIEKAQAAGAGPVRSREAPQDDVPPEYTDRPQDEPKEE